MNGNTREKITRWLLPISLGTTLLVHFILLALYANPLRPADKPAPYRAHWYAYPFFHQTWNLFAPPPRDNYRLYYECSTPHGLRKGELLSEIRSEVQANVFSGYGGILTAFGNSIYYFVLLAEKRDPINHVANDPRLKMVVRTATAFLAWRDTCSSVKIFLQVKNADGGSRIYIPGP
jgi:hypothetical protein